MHQEWMYSDERRGYMLGCLGSLPNQVDHRKTPDYSPMQYMYCLPLYYYLHVQYTMQAVYTPLVVHIPAPLPYYLICENTTRTQISVHKAGILHAFTNPHGALWVIMVMTMAACLLVGQSPLKEGSR